MRRPLTTALALVLSFQAITADLSSAAANTPAPYNWGATEFYGSGDNAKHMAQGKVTPIRIEPQLIAAAQDVLNRKGIYIPEPKGIDKWKISWIGDCEDQALAVMKWLHEKGVPLEAMRILYTPPTKKRLGHAILCIWDAERGPICIDSLSKTPTFLKDKPGKWFEALSNKRVK
jgi:hypothetical protein